MKYHKFTMVMALTIAFSGTLFAAGGSESDGMYIPVISKGLQHQFWQTVKAGAEAAATDYGVDITFEGPASEADIQDQVQMLQNAMAKNPTAIALAALDTNSVMDQLEEAIRLNIPVIGFDSGVPDAPVGAIHANASTDNYVAAGLAAEQMFAAIKGDIESATADQPVTVVTLNENATGESVLNRGRGFRDRLIALIVDETAHSLADIQVMGNPAFIDADSPTTGDKVMIDMVVSATPRTQDAVAATSAVFNRVQDDRIMGIFATNEGMVVAILAATNDGADLTARYGQVSIIGFDAGEAQKNAVRKQDMLGSITQDPYQIGYQAVKLAYEAANGESVSDVDTGAKFYNYQNMSQPDIAQLLYD